MKVIPHQFSIITEKVVCTMRGFCENQDESRSWRNTFLGVCSIYFVLPRIVVCCLHSLVSMSACGAHCSAAVLHSFHHMIVRPYYQLCLLHPACCRSQPLHGSARPSFTATHANVHRCIKAAPTLSNTVFNID